MRKKPDRVLIVDDDDGLLTILSRSLTRSGFEVVTASDGVEGFEVLKNSPPFAVMVTDLMMPNMHGLDLLRRARKFDPYLEIIVITAAGSIESAIAAMRDGGAYDYMQKPFETMKEVNLTVERAAAHRRLVLERMHLQKQAETDAKRLQALIANVGDAILSADSDGFITVANPAAIQLLSHPEGHRDDLVGQKVAVVLPPKLATIVDNWQVIAGDRPVSMEIHWTDKTIQMISLTPLDYRDGKQQGWTMVLRDITTLKRMDKLKTRALAAAIGKIRVPMAEAMSAVVDLNLRASQDDRLTESLFRLTQVWEQIKTWGDELLTVVQSDTERNIHPTRVDPHKVLDSLKEDKAIQYFQQGGGKFELHTPTSLPSVHTDPRMLFHLLQNLINRATSRGSRNREIQVSAREYQGQVWIEMSDGSTSPNGGSAPKSAYDRDTELTAGLLNASLDLMRARSLLEQLNGQLWISSKGAEGHTIIICLPVYESPSDKKVPKG